MIQLLFVLTVLSNNCVRCSTEVLTTYSTSSGAKIRLHDEDIREIRNEYLKVKMVTKVIDLMVNKQVKDWYNLLKKRRETYEETDNTEYNCK